jgi:sulfatase maturation enzyme AslB (radical SAM superfamily)
MGKKNHLMIRLVHRFISRVMLRKPEIEFQLNLKYGSWKAIFFEAANYFCYLLRLEKSFRLTSVVFEVTNTCNLRCLTCPVNRGMKRKKGFADVKLFKKILDENKDLMFVLTYGWGEPLLNKELYKFVDYSLKKGVPVHISTNATLLNRQSEVDRLLNSGISLIQISLDGVGETYKKVRGVDYGKTKSNIELLLKRRKELGKEQDVTVNLNVVIFKETEKEAEMVRELWKDKVDYVLLTPMSIIQKTKRKTPCFELWRGNIVVFWDGTCVPCCVDAEGVLNLGDANKEPLDRIWNGKTMGALRRAHSCGRFFGLCGSCYEYETNLTHERFK